MKDIPNDKIALITLILFLFCQLTFIVVGRFRGMELDMNINEHIISIILGSLITVAISNIKK